MNVTLREEDRRAVDLILDQGVQAAAADGIGSVYATADASLGQRVARAQEMLHLLDYWPAAEPPVDLASRTVRLVYEARTSGAAVRSPLPNLLGSQRPQA
jgi:hypothetical protein